MLSNHKIILYLINWFGYYETIITISINFLSLIITSSLTFLIIKQTKSLNTKQLEITKKLNFEQTELQRKQIVIDSFQFKREIYSHVFSVLELCYQIQELTNKMDLNSLSVEKLKDLIEILLNQYVPNVKQTLWSMREAEYIISENISTTIIEIRSDFDKMISHFSTPLSISRIISESKTNIDIEQIKNENITAAIECCKRINKHSRFIESIMPVELDISKLSK